MLPNTDVKVRLNSDFSSEKLSKYIDLVIDGRVTPQPTGDAPIRQLKALGIEIDDYDYDKLKTADFNTLSRSSGQVRSVPVLVVVAVVAITYAR